MDQLIQWIDLWYFERSEPSLYENRLYSAPELWDMVCGRLPLLGRIGDALEPERPHKYTVVADVEGLDPWSYVREEAVRLRGILADAELTESIFDPGGPRLAANQMHPWVWTTAERLWATGHYREALQASATAVEAQAQAKTGRYDTSGADLFRKVFHTDSPRPGEPRLRLDYPMGGQSWTSAHEGASNFGAGCMMAIRNIVTHNLATPDEAEGLQQLAALSVLARWVDQARVEKVSEKVLPPTETPEPEAPPLTIG